MTQVGEATMIIEHLGFSQAKKKAANEFLALNKPLDILHCSQE